MVTSRTWSDADTPFVIVMPRILIDVTHRPIISAIVEGSKPVTLLFDNTLSIAVVNLMSRHLSDPKYDSVAKTSGGGACNRYTS